ncbi:MAG: hypothetical protein JNL22_05995 [Bacteroidales bacterium]|nr:hypothetical protein [Bacteroidales bacterium]
MKTLLTFLLSATVFLAANGQQSNLASDPEKGLCKVWKLSSSSQAGQTYQAGTADQGIQFVFNADHTFSSSGTPGGDTRGVWILNPTDQSLFLYTYTGNPDIPDAPYASTPLALTIESLSTEKVSLAIKNAAGNGIVNTFTAVSTKVKTPSINHQRCLDQIKGTWKNASARIPEQEDHYILTERFPDANEAAERLTFKPDYTCIWKTVLPGGETDEENYLWNYDSEKAVIIIVRRDKGSVERLLTNVQCEPGKLVFHEDIVHGTGIFTMIPEK